ncbi:hypothetical protein RJ641_011409 [Dillenia turbinata]|uniref:RING-type domain-containing protein n=1 Tax=Dillenia turbinata TaxID=194707 RepID=A0AAN8UWC7_9MAGN
MERSSPVANRRKQGRATQRTLVMCSLDGMRLNFHLPNPHPATLTSTFDDDPAEEWCFAVFLVVRLIAYFAVLGVLVLIISMILKYLANCEIGRDEEEGSHSETNPLRPQKAIPVSYGTYNDLESGNSSGSGSSSGSSSSSNTMSSEDLYDGKICVICYDDPRDCFFVPCGHCATCYLCALRIIEEGETRVCPVCRRYIHKVRKLLL